MTVSDLLRLVAVPVLGWAAWRDVETRRVPSRIWYPLLGLGVLLLAWDFVSLPSDPVAQRLFLVRVAVSVALIGGLGLGFWRFGAFGLADAKAFVVIAVLFPTFPTYRIGELLLPAVRPPLGVFSLTIVTDAVLLGMFFPFGLYLLNTLRGVSSPKGFFYYSHSVESLLTTQGVIYIGSVPEGSLVDRVRYYLSMLKPRKDRLDLDALRMYLRWRGIALSDLRSYPDELRRPATLPADPNDPTDGAVDPEADPDPVGGIPPASFGGPEDDPWGAEAFLEAAGGAYGTTPEGLRDGLEVVAHEDDVWVSPGLPFLVPVFFGLLVALVVGDLLYLLLDLAGLA